MGRNKLECLYPVRFIQASLILASKANILSEKVTVDKHSSLFCTFVHHE